MAINTEPRVLRLAIGTPSAGIIHAAYVMSITRTVLHFLQTPIRTRDFDKKEVISQILLGANIGSSRDKMVDWAIKENCTHLLFIDDDMGFMPEALHCMLERQLPIVICNYRRKIPPGFFTCYNQNSLKWQGEIRTTPESTSCEEIEFGGFGFALMEVEALKQIPKPRFLMYYDPDFDIYTTEDKPFFERAKAAGIPAFVDHDASKFVWHNGTFNYCYDQELKPEWSVPTPERLEAAYREQHKKV